MWNRNQKEASMRLIDHVKVMAASIKLMDTSNTINITSTMDQAIMDTMAQGIMLARIMVITITNTDMDMVTVVNIMAMDIQNRENLMNKENGGSSTPMFEWIQGYPL